MNTCTPDGQVFPFIATSSAYCWCCVGNASFVDEADSWLTAHWDKEVDWAAPMTYWPTVDSASWPAALLLLDVLHGGQRQQPAGGVVGGGRLLADMGAAAAAVARHRGALSLMMRGWLQGKVRGMKNKHKVLARMCAHAPNTMQHQLWCCIVLGSSQPVECFMVQCCSSDGPLAGPDSAVPCHHPRTCMPTLSDPHRRRFPGLLIRPCPTLQQRACLHCCGHTAQLEPALLLQPSTDSHALHCSRCVCLCLCVCVCVHIHDS